jgi:uncharacterized membrane protein YhhN
MLSFPQKMEANMKYATVIALMIMMLPMAAAAQMRSSDRITANVPFEFIAWDRVVPAGDCIVQRATPYGTTLAIVNPGKAVSTFALSREDRGKPATGAYALVFHRYGNRHFLSQVKIADGTVYMVPETKLERELRAQNITAQDQIVLASLK